MFSATTKEAGLETGYKTRTAFVLFDYSPSLGVQILANVLREAGHPTSILFARDRDFRRQVARFDPELVGFSLTSGLVQKGLAMAGWIKACFPKAKTVFGGPHPTFSPELVENEHVDFVARGEGEISMPALAQRIQED